MKIIIGVLLRIICTPIMFYADLATLLCGLIMWEDHFIGSKSLTYRLWNKKKE